MMLNNTLNYDAPSNTKNHFDNIVSEIKANSYETISAPEETGNEQEEREAE